MKKLYRLSALVAVAALVVIGSVAPLVLPANAALVSHTLANNLIAYWTLDEASSTRSDSVGANHLTDNNTVTQNTGKLGNAAQFTAENSEYLSIADNADLSTGDIDFTISLWLYADSLIESANRRIAIKGTEAASTMEWTLIQFTDSVVVFDIRPNGSTSNAAVGNTAISAGVWYHFIAWHDSVLNLTGIVVNNGTPQTANTAGAPADRAGAFQLGTETGSSQFFDGRIDSVGFWKRVLTSDEIATLYNGGAGCDYPFTACEATHTPAATNTFTPTSTATATYTATSTMTDTATAVNTSTSTATNTATATFTPTDTATASNTPLVSDTPTSTATDTATATSTATPTLTATAIDSFSVPLSSGNRFFVDRRATFGEGYIVVGIIGLIVFLSFRWLYDLVRQWLS